MNKFENLILWTGTKVKLEYKHQNNDQSSTLIPRNSIYTCLLGENVGYEKGANKPRPVLVVSNDTLNSRSGNIIVIPLSKNIKWDGSRKKGKLKYDSHYVLYKSKYTKLDYDSAVQCEDIRCVSKARLGKFVCFIDEIDVLAIKKRLKYTLQV